MGGNNRRLIAFLKLIESVQMKAIPAFRSSDSPFAFMCEIRLSRCMQEKVFSLERIGTYDPWLIIWYFLVRANTQIERIASQNINTSPTSNYTECMA